MNLISTKTNQYHFFWPPFMLSVYKTYWPHSGLNILLDFARNSEVERLNLILISILILIQYERGLLKVMARRPQETTRLITLRVC